MKMNIPSIGDKIKLTKDWTFPCFWQRNHIFIGKMRPDTEGHKVDSVAITLPKGTILSVQRIYIRSGKKEWDSLTFSLKGMPTPKPVVPEPIELDTPQKGRKIAKKVIKRVIAKVKKTTGRFWVKLRDANEIEYEPVEE